jgi:anti-sigma B factor antagonist
MPELHCQLRRIPSPPGAAVVTLRGALDPKNVTLLIGALKKVGDRGLRTLILDLAEIRYINSMGLGSLINLADGLAAHGGGLVLAAPNPKVKVVFDLMGITQFFKMHKSVDAAIAAIARPKSAGLRKQASSSFVPVDASRSPRAGVSLQTVLRRSI